jgi:hypothetical protein
VSGIPFEELSSKRINTSELLKYNIAIIPNITANTLKVKEIESIKFAVNSGLNIFLDGSSKLAQSFGIELEKEHIEVSQIKDMQFADIPLYWKNHAHVSPVKLADKNYEILCIETRSKAPLCVCIKYGKGKVIYYSPLFDPESGKGYSRFPFLIETFSKYFGYEGLVRRKIASMYFDPGNRNTLDLENLIKTWKKNGIHTIYAAAWYEESFDYEKLIRLCHENGILVFSWLEFPMKSKDFWDAQPQWREKTAMLEDAHIDWRYLVNLADDSCRNEVFKQTQELLDKYDWDGVDLAELYFESTEGPRDPDRFTPMNDTVRNEFRNSFGFDPVEIFDENSPHYWKKNDNDWRAFADFRIELCNRIKDYCIEFLAGVRESKKDFEIVITAMDASSGPFLEYNIAEDTEYLLKLVKTYGLTLQVQDEWMFWTGKPERYFFLGNYYRKFIKEPSALELDFNVVESHPEGEGGLPAQKPTGEEMRQVVYNMSINNTRPVFYSEDSIYEHDFNNISTILARDAVITEKNNKEWKINTPYMVYLRVGRANNKVLLNGRIWRAFNDEDIIIPSGKNILRFEIQPKDPGDKGKPCLNYISAELEDASFYDNSIELSYLQDASPCYAVVNFKPEKVFVDKIMSECKVYSSREGFCVKLPGGEHFVKIYAFGQ